jgi:hypothetical protein
MFFPFLYQYLDWLSYTPSLRSPCFKINGAKGGGGGAASMLTVRKLCIPVLVHLQMQKSSQTRNNSQTKAQDRVLRRLLRDVSKKFVSTVKYVYKI